MLIDKVPYEPNGAIVGSEKTMVEVVSKAMFWAQLRYRAAGLYHVVDEKTHDALYCVEEGHTRPCSENIRRDKISEAIIAALREAGYLT